MLEFQWTARPLLLYLGLPVANVLQPTKQSRNAVLNSHQFLLLAEYCVTYTTVVKNGPSLATVTQKDANVSQGSVVTCLKCEGIVIHYYKSTAATHNKRILKIGQYLAKFLYPNSNPITYYSNNLHTTVMAVC